MAMKELICPQCKFRQKVKDDVVLATHSCHVSGKYAFVMIPVETEKKAK